MILIIINFAQGGKEGCRCFENSLEKKEMNNFRLREVTKGSIPPDALCVGGNVNGMMMFTHLKSRVAKPLFFF